MIPLEILTGGGAFILGAVAKLFMMRMEMKHHEQKALMERAGLVKDAREYGKTDKQFSWTRRVIALSVTAMVSCPIWAPFVGDLLDMQIAVAIPLVDEENLKVLWGMFNYTDKVTTYKYVTTVTYLPEYSHYFSSVLGLYMGSKIK